MDDLFYLYATIFFLSVLFPLLYSFQVAYNLLKTCKDLSKIDV